MNNNYLVIFTLIVVEVTSQGFYKVIGPRTVRPNSEHHVAISVQATSQPTAVTATLRGVTNNGAEFAAFDRIIVAPYTSRMCRLEIGDAPPGDYKMVISGTGGLDFSADYALDYVNKSYSVFIQTDRAVYSPASRILFRAIVLNSQLKPAAEVRDELLHIFVADGRGNRIKEWRGVHAIRGVFAEEVVLAQNPVLGSWSISVTVHGQTFRKQVEVAEYVLPKFLVDVQAPKHLTFKDNNLVVAIQTRYAYGQKVKGEATVSVYPTIFSGVIQPIFQNPIRKVVPIEGAAVVEFDVENELKLSNEYERVVVVDVAVEEFATGRRQNNSVEVHLHKYDYKMELVKTADYFKPGLMYTAYVKVSNHDGSPLKGTNGEVTVRHGYSRADEVYTEARHRLDNDGIVKLDYATPSNATNTTALRIEAEYQGLKERISPIPAAVSFSNNFLKISLETERPRVNLEVEVLVNCTEPLKYIDYVLMGRGDVLIANTLQVYGGTEYRFHFTATHAMVPVAHLIVSYTRPDGELIGDALDIEVDGLLQNFIDIQVNTVEAEPDLDVDLTIRSQPNSYIGLMAVDQNVQKLRAEYDLSQKIIADELKRYDRAPQPPFSGVMKDSKYHFFWSPGANNPHSAIYESGADLLTNAHVNYLKPTLEDIYLRPVFYDSSTVKPDLGFGLSFNSVTRPPLAGPYAFSRIPRPVWNRPKVYLTEDIANTWLFTNFSSGYEGKTSIRRKIPNTLNTWIVTGFSLDPLHGLGLVTSPKKIKVSKSFVVSIDLPYSIQKDEILAVPVVIYNYMNRDVNADVTLHNPEKKFEFAEVSNSINFTQKAELYRRKTVRVKRNGASSVSFMIKPLIPGSIEVKVTASSPGNQDVVVKKLLVKPGGDTEYYAKTLLIDLRKSGNFKGSVNVTFPKNLIEGSEKVEVAVVGDLLGPTLINLARLIRLPTECGEQNLVNFMPNLIVLQYLKQMKQTNPTIEREAISLLETAYQQQLSFRQKDGSFSIFELDNGSSSIWITAYVALAFRQAEPYIYVDESIIKGCLQWLKEKQRGNGGFFENGPIIHQELENSNGLALTAFVLLSFIENQKYDSSYINIIHKGLDFIARNIEETQSSYSIALCSYVLQVAKHTSKQGAFNVLDSISKSKDNRKWWGKNVPKGETNNPWNHLPRSIDIETTSYALLSFMEANLLNDAVPILNWLVDQQNNIGGFTSSQDTVIGLFAIYKLVSKLTVFPSMQIEFAYREQERSKFSINKNSAMVVQKQAISSNVKQVNVTAEGSGLALFRVSYQYNTNVTGPWPLFTLDPQIDKSSNKNFLQISICTGFVSRNLSDFSESNMAVMEVNLPSGFTVDTDSLPSLEVSQNVQRVKTANSLTKVILYFYNLTSTTEYCPTISAFRTHKVAKQKPVSVTVYDYYDSSRRARIFYYGKISTLCDICENEDCGDICTLDPKPLQTLERPKNGNDEKGGSTFIVSNWKLISTMILSLVIIIL